MDSELDRLWKKVYRGISTPTDAVMGVTNLPTQGKHRPSSLQNQKSGIEKRECTA